MQKIRYRVAAFSDLVPDVGLVVPLGEDGGSCTLFLHQGVLYAVGSLCPHQNASLNDAPAECGQVICKRHGYRFDLKTGDCVTLAGYGLPVFDIQLEEDSIFVSVWDFA